jgi:hypothetical protein
MNCSNSSDSPNSDDFSGLEVAVAPLARWDVYFYLQEHSIPCQCKYGQPLRVQIDSAAAAMLPRPYSFGVLFKFS